MHFVAEFAASAPIGLIDMEIMEIDGSVAKPGGIGGIRKHKQIPLVAGETELVCLVGIVDERFSGVAFREQFFCHVAMGIMTEMTA